MARKTIKNSRLIEYRAKCEDCRYKGNWTENEDEANSDAIEHMSEPENETHVAKVIARQRNR